MKKCLVLCVPPRNTLINMKKWCKMHWNLKKKFLKKKVILFLKNILLIFFKGLIIGKDIEVTDIEIKYEKKDVNYTVQIPYTIHTYILGK